MSSDHPKKSEERSPLLRAYQAIKDLEAKLEAAQQARHGPIAVVGLGCRFPGAEDPAAFWDLLRSGRDAIGEVPSERWDASWYDPAPQTPGKSYTRHGGYLSDVAEFDADFFGIAPREAESLDPQQRLLLEVAWEALENAGLHPHGLAGSRTGVYVGVMNLDYPNMLLAASAATRIDAFYGTGGEASFPAGRLSYYLGLQGPSLVVATACSSSLTAVHLACQALRNGECRQALAGGVNLILNPRSNVVLCKMSALSPDGRCKTFDARADGYGRGEGCGLIVLKRLADARADGDTVLALIRGSAVNHGGPSGGLTVPNGPAQEAVIRDALRAAGVDPAQIGYVEAHGTGTALGDPIELRALAAALGEGRSLGQRFWVGSVKTNVGHLESAAGIAGLIKVILTLQHGAIPPHLHFQQPNPHIPWAELPLDIPTKLTPWPQGDAPRRAGISSFGLSGINAHVIVEEAPAAETATVGTRNDLTPLAERPYHLLSLSARSEPALRDLAARWERHLTAHPAAALADMAFTANTGRVAFAKRLAVVTESTEQARAALAEFAAGRIVPELRTGHAPEDAAPRVAFLFSGHGAQYAGMGRLLYESQPTVRQTLEQCAALAAPHLERPLLSVLYPSAAGSALLEEPQYAWPALFALEYALAQLWLSWGVRPGALLGHGIGEYVAACVGGVFTPADAIRLLIVKARLVQKLPADEAVAAVFADEERVAAAAAPFAAKVSLAAVNEPHCVVIAGERRALQAVLTTLERAGIAAEMWKGALAVHSPTLEPRLDELEGALRRIDLGTPQRTLISGLGRPLTDSEATDPGYWRRQVRQPVRFAEGLRGLHQQGYDVFVEIGPAATLLQFGRRCQLGDCTWLSSLRPERDDWLQLLETLQELHVRGVPIDFTAFDRDYPRRKLALPTYPFQRRRYWHEELLRRPAEHDLQIPLTNERPLLGRRVSAALKEKVFASRWGVETLPLLADHRVHGMVLAPATCFLAAAVAAGRELLGQAACTLEGTAFQGPLLLPGDAARSVQMILTPRENGRLAFELHSQPTEPEGDGPWTLHAAGTLHAADATDIGSPTSALDELLSRCTRVQTPTAFYAALAATGLALGPRFQCLERIHSGFGEALGLLRRPVDATECLGTLPPGLLDSCLQLVAAALPPERTLSDAYVPLGVDRFYCDDLGTGPLWCHAVLRSADPTGETVTADLRLFTEDRRMVASLTGLSLKRATAAALLGGSKPADWLYEVTWTAVPRLVLPSNGASLGRWIILADVGGVGTALADGLRKRGAVCEVASATADLDQFFASASVGPPLQGVVYFAALNERETEPGELAPRHVCGSVLALVQGLIRAGVAPRLWLVTRGARAVGCDPVALAQAPLAGLARVIALEHPELRCTCVDLDPTPRPDEAESLLAEVCAPDGEDQVARRDGERRGARLVRAELPEIGDNPAVQLVQARPGVLDSLTVQALTRRPPGLGEVELRVGAAGLNFRDVLGALGLYPGDAGPLGGECAGTIVGVGAGVQGLAIGDEVIALASGCLRSFVTVRSELVAVRPARLSCPDAAGVPVAFLTARFALEELAHLARGERVLIHAAAGGVGLAALQLAQRLGAEVFATAGSQAKRAYLQSLGVQHVFDSRNPAFTDEVRAATGGAGVHVVLNSLTGEFITKGLELLVPSGRFVEIGKTEIWDLDRVQKVRGDVSYHAFALDRLTIEEPRRIGAALRRLMDDFAAGSLRPGHRHTFPLSAAGAAFRFMAQARHTGKIVITVGATVHSGPRADGVYLVTGGLGALGLRAACWLAAQGAKHLVLLGRRVPSDNAAAVLRELTEQGVLVQTIQADVADREELRRVLQDLTDLRGVVHTAGVLEDGVLADQTWDRFERVLAPKALGAWHLHELTRDLPLDFFVLYSSAAALLGAPGQGNYAAANAFLDALAQHRRATGLPALSINWGPWDETGMAARVDGRRHWAAQGMDTIPPPEGDEILGRLLRSSAVQVGVLPVRWPAFLQRFAGRVPPLLANFAANAPSSSSRTQQPASDLHRRLKSAPAGGQRDVLAAFVTEEARNLLGPQRAGSVDARTPLQDLGFDSLMAVELRNVLGHAFGQPLPATLLFNYPTVDALVGYLAVDVLRQELEASAPPAKQEPRAPGSAVTPSNSGGVADRVLADIEQISDADVDRMLAAMTVEGRRT